jgi:hypothetical protein
MRTKGIARVGWGCAVAAALVTWGLAAPPVGANVVATTIDDGVLTLYEPFVMTPVAQIDLSNAVSCTEGNTLDATGTASSGTLDGTITVMTPAVDVYGDPTDYVASIDATIDGTYGGSDVVVDQVFEIQLKEQGPSQCSATGSVLCTVVGANLGGGGSIWSPSLPTLASDDVLSTGAESGDFDTYVSGSDCGHLVLADNGPATLELVSIVI